MSSDYPLASSNLFTGAGVFQVIILCLLEIVVIMLKLQSNLY